MLGDIHQGAHLILGSAGSGKTTTLRSRAGDLIRSGTEPVLILVGGRRAARALSEQILRDLDESTDRVQVSTWHAYAWSVLRTWYPDLGHKTEPALLNGPEQFTVVRDLLGSGTEQEHWTIARPHLRMNGFIQELREFVLRAQDALESPETLVERARLARRPDLEEAARFFRRYLTHIDELGLVDHANVICQVISLMQQVPSAAERIRTEAGHLLVDDLQDVTPAQLTLLRELLGAHVSVTATADMDQQVFGFRGSVPTIVDDYRRSFAPVVETTLTEVHRRAADRRAWLFDHVTEEGEAIAREARKRHARDGVAYGQMAVIVRRYGSVSRAIRRALERADVPYVVVGENRPLPAEPALKPMLDLARVALRTEARDELLPSVLASPAVGLDPYDVRALRREARVRGVPLSTVIAAPPAALGEQVAQRLEALRDLLDRIVEMDARGDSADDVFWVLWEGMDHFRQMVADGADADLDAVVAFARSVQRFSERRMEKTFGDYLSVLEGVDFGPEPWRVPEDRRPDALRLMTAHNAVGSDAEVVFVAGAVEGQFPDVRQARAILDVRDLIAPASPIQRHQATLQEEARLFAVATSRARAALVVTASRESSQREALTPSPLVEAAGLTWEAPTPDDEPLDAAEAEALWRRIASDTARPDAERLAAVENLARLSTVDPDRWWYQRDWTYNDTPIMPEGWRTSYSRMAPYEDCGLKYLYDKGLGLDPEQTHAMLVGNWIHDIVDRCARGEVEPTIEALHAELAALWNPVVFPSPAIEHRYRLECRLMLQRWLDADGKVKPLQTEVEFNFPLDGVTIRGFIDRVVRCGTKSVRLIDYKTGKSYKSQTEVEDDLQLATYYLALKRDPALATMGEPMRLELAYVAAPRNDSGFARVGFDPRRDPAFEERSEARLLSLIEGIRAERFAPNPGADCRFCKFKSLCPVWPEGDEVAP